MSCQRNPAEGGGGGGDEGTAGDHSQVLIEINRTTFKRMLGLDIVLTSLILHALVDPLNLVFFFF